MVRDKVGPVAAFKIAIIVKRLPKTRSGKILRVLLEKLQITSLTKCQQQSTILQF